MIPKQTISEFNSAVVVTLAQMAHEGQTRKNGGPYIEHPKRVAAAAFRATGNYDVWAAGMLHDTVEDSKGKVTIDIIAELVSPKVAGVVDFLTHRPGEPYFDYVARCIQNEWAAQIKRSDLLDNLSDLPFDHKNFKRYVKALEMISDRKF